jgi:NTP pyrophosphatase (non-canonical NTP hydrolase)
VTEPTLNEIVRRSFENSKSKGFWDGQLDPKDLSFVPEKLALIHSEVSECLESYRKKEPLIHYPGGGMHVSGECRGTLTGQPRCNVCLAPSKPEGMASELADIVIRVADLSGRLGIDLGRAVEEKHAFNLTRSHKHGGKVC